MGARPLRAREIARFLGLQQTNLPDVIEKLPYFDYRAREVRAVLCTARLYGFSGQHHISISRLNPACVAAVPFVIPDKTYPTILRDNEDC